MEIINVPAFSHDKIADEPIDSAGIPQPESFADDKVPLVVSHENGSQVGLSQVSAAHGRSYLLDHSPAQGTWIDPYGNPYSVITTKGNNLTRNDLMRSGTAPSGFLPYGLQEGDALGRVAIASRIIREVGVDTERPVGLFQPRQLVFEGRLVDVPDYKQLLIEGMVEKIKTGEDNVYDFTLEEVGAAAEALDRMDFFVTLRAMSTAARIGDMTVCETGLLGNNVYKGLHYGNLSQTFRDYNNFAVARAGLIRDLGLAARLPAEVSPGTDKDVLEHYFSEILPKLMANNTGLVHSLGLLHCFPHENNFTGLGAIVDLDSVRGERLQLGDKFDEGHGTATGQQVSEKTEISIEVLNTMRRYAGHGIDWQTVGRHARENFTQVYMDTYDGSMSPSDRIKVVFMDVAFAPGGLWQNGSSLELESLERFYPGAKAVIDEIEALAEVALTDKLFMRTTEFAWYVLDYSQDAFNVWGKDEVTTEERDEYGELLLNLGLPPTDEKILEILPSLYEADKEYGKSWSQAAYMVSLLPLLKERIKGDLENNSSSALDIPKEFLGRLPGHKDVDIEDVRRHLEPVHQEVLARLATKLEEPSVEEFWGIARKLFKERVLDTFDRSILPENDFIRNGDFELEEHVAFWEFHRDAKIIEHVCSNVPAEKLEAMLADNSAEPQFVDGPDQLLQIEPSKDEEVRLVITDGTINNHIYYEDYGGEFEDINYRQYMLSNGSLPTNATVAVFLLQKGDAFRVVHKKLRLRGE